MTGELIPQDPQITSLQEMIKEAFPQEKYTGAITQFDPGPWVEELDEEQVLYQTLKGKSWAEVSSDFIQAHPDS